MRKERDSRKDKDLLLYPFDVMKFGTADDPCFGKLYDLTSEECQNCGDHEVCAIAFVRKLGSKRIQAELDTHAKDLEIDQLELDMDIKKFIKVKVERNFSQNRAVSMASKKYHVGKERITNLI